jgi:GT2 family glycosyltransferase
MYDISIVIVNWNTKELLKNCLHSIYSNQGTLQLDVIVIDNASSDLSADMVREAFPQVNLIENTQNVGFAKANNQAFPLCKSEFVLLLNPDTRVLGNALQILVDFLINVPHAGAIGPKVIHPEMRLRVLSCGYQPSIRTLFNQYFFLSSLVPRVSAFRGVNLIMGIHDDKVREVEWISGACLLIRRTVIEQVGALSEEWFMYAEDMEWCERITRAGWKLYHIPQATIEHLVGAGASQNKIVSTMWVQSLHSYYVSRVNASRFKSYFFALILMIGLQIRVIYYNLRAWFASTQRVLWENEAQKFSAYAKAAYKITKNIP